MIRRPPRSTRHDHPLPYPTRLRSHTPVFSHLMTYVEINPYWNVPPSIARDELLPKIKQDASYLAKHNYVLFSDWSSGAAELDPQSIDWTQVSGASFQIGRAHV